jgi:predicted restriction endonuclease
LKKGLERFKEHEESVAHKAAYAATIPKVGEQSSIASTYNTISLGTQQLRRQGLISHLQTLKTLLCQGVAIRGNTDSESNIYQFNVDKAINDRGLKLLIDENRYVTAHDILEEQKRALVLRARKHLLDEILTKEFFSILADESSDISKTEQLSFCVRTCNANYEVSEDFVGVFDCSQGVSSESLLHYTKDILLRCGMDGNRMAAMGFDGLQR